MGQAGGLRQYDRGRGATGISGASVCVQRLVGHADSVRPATRRRAGHSAGAPVRTIARGVKCDRRIGYPHLLRRHPSKTGAAAQKSDSPAARSVVDVGVGQPHADSLRFEFRPLWQLSGHEKAEIAQKSVSSIVEALEAGLLDRASAMKELRGLSHETGLFGSVDDAQIAAAEEAPPPVMEAYAHAGA